MQTNRWLAGFAAMLVACLAIACGDRAATEVRLTNPGPLVIDTNFVYNGSCHMTLEIHNIGNHVVSKGIMAMLTNDITRVETVQFISPADPTRCPRMHFKYSTSNFGLDSLDVPAGDTVGVTVKTFGLTGSARNCVVPTGADSVNFLCYTLNVNGSGGTGNVCTVVGLTVTATDSSLNVGQTAQINANQSTNGIAGCSSPTYSSSNNSVATVSASGLVTGVSAGTAVVTISSSNNFSRQITFTVTGGGTGGTSSSIDYTPRGGTITDSVVLTAIVSRGSSDTLAADPVWSVSDGSSLTIKGDGTPETHSGTTVYPGMHATLKVVRASSSSFIVCVNWHPLRGTPSACYTWGPISPTSGIDLMAGLHDVFPGQTSK